MTSAVDRLSGPVVGAAGSEGTVVEQSRAVAEVFAAAELAVRFPRDEGRAEAAMRRACARLALAEQAEYALPVDGDQVTGPTVHLARELATIWGNITHGVTELSRNPARGQSELLAYAWDVQTNVRSARTVIIPHTRDRRAGARELTKQADITNQNNSIAARQLRETIFSVLPKWYTAEAITECRATLARQIQSASGGVEGGADRAVAAFSAGGVTQQQLETYLGLPRARWDVASVSKLQMLFRSLKAGDVRRDDVFPPEPSGDVMADVAPAAAPSPAPGAGDVDLGGADPDADGEYDPTTQPGWPGADREADRV